MTRTSNNMLLLVHGFILVTTVATATSAEAEITMEAAFQGHCGHTSPCEQLCYEIHDGMYECDCIEGYELNKNGYSCQVINSTNSSDGRSKSDEDVLYQKGASFSAKLAADNNNMNNYMIGNESDGDSYGDGNGVNTGSIDDNYINDAQNVNSNDYYISAESISFSNEQDADLYNSSQDVPEFHSSNLERTSQQEQQQDAHKMGKAAVATITPTTKRPSNRKLYRTQADRKSQKVVATTRKPSTATAGKSAAARDTATSTTVKPEMYAKYNMEDEYYSKQDMSIYDDVNNNQLNLRPLNQNTYQPTLYAASKQASMMYGNPAIGVDVWHPEVKQNLNISTDNSAPVGEACNLECGPDGLCERQETGGSRCSCPFGRTGANCAEDVTVRVPKFSKKSWLAFPALRGAYKHVQIRVEFRPESFDGIVLLSGERDDLTGDFMALLLNKGFVEFWFDCGSGVGSVRSRETILLNEWNSVIIYRHRWDAWMVLNHGSKVQGRSNGLFSRITFREPVFLGGTGNITGLAKRLPVFSGFIGCIRRFVANEHEYKFVEHPLGDVTKGFDIQDCVTDKCFKYPCQHGGKCLATEQGAVCLCPIGFVGDLCEIRMDLQVPAFNGTSYLRYAPLGDSALIWLELKVILKPEHSDGLILYSGSGGKHGDFIALSLNNGFVEFTFDLGSGPAVVRSDHPLTNGQWHTIKLSRTARLAVLKIDQSPEVMTISSNGFWHLSLPENLFLGGVNHIDKLPLVFKSNPFFTGCIQKIDINGHSVSIISEALGGSNIGNCPHACVARPCGPFSECVPQMESYECRCSAPFNTHCNKVAEMHAMNSNIGKNNSTVPGTSGVKGYIGSNNKQAKPSNEQYDWKAKKAQIHKQIKHIKGHSRYGHKAHTSPKTTPQIPTTFTTTTTMMDAKKNLLENDDYIQIDDDDIIYREVHDIHKDYGQRMQVSRPQSITKIQTQQRKQEQQPELKSMAANVRQQQRLQESSGTHKQRIATDSIKKESIVAGTTISPVSEPAEQVPNVHQSSRDAEDLTNKHHGHHHYHHHQHQHKNLHKQKQQNQHLSSLRQHLYATKPDPYYQKPSLFNTAKFEQKLSRLPTHYESFQTNPDSDILTFDDNIELQASEEYREQPPEYVDNYEYVYPAEVIKSEQTLAGGASAGFEQSDQQHSEFIMDEKTLFDEQDSADEYHHEQLAQDMRRIMANTPRERSTSTTGSTTTITSTTTTTTAVPTMTRAPNLVVDVYDYIEDGEVSTYVNDRINTQNNNGGDDDLLEPVHDNSDYDVVVTKQTTTQQTPHTDWSLLKKFELSADHQSQIGVHKNFGACFAGEDSYFHYSDADTMSQIISYNIDLNLRIKTHSQNGIILWTGRQGSTDEHADYLSLGIEDGYLHFRYDLGSGEVDIRFNMTKVSDGLWHRVRALRVSQGGYLEVDGRKSVTLRSPGKLRQLNTDTGLYVGGMPDVSYFTRRKYQSGIVGCISEIILAGELKLNFDPNTLGTAHNVETGIL